MVVVDIGAAVSHSAEQPRRKREGGRSHHKRQGRSRRLDATPGGESECFLSLGPHPDDCAGGGVLA